MKYIIPVLNAAVWGIWAALMLWFHYKTLAIVCYIAIVLALPFESLVHELGHMLFGAIVRIKAVPRFSLFGSSSCKIIPRTDKHLRMRVLFTSFGGITVNFLFSIVGLVGLFIPEVAYLSVFLPASSYLFWLNVQPLYLGADKTDGLVIHEFYHNEDSAKVTVAVLTAQAQILKGKRIEEVDKDLLFSQPVIREDDPAFISLTELKRDYLLAVGQPEQAQILTDRLEQLKEYL
ncbi:MAG: hypothetical protein K2L12_05620 [Clostridia bacterium]|nr:hypothetical protein [Clostridia bacterium]